MIDPGTAGLSIEAKGDKRTWRYYRRMSRSSVLVRLTGGAYPAVSIKDARRWADELNQSVEAGIDPRVEAKAAKAAGMTLADGWALFWADMSSGKRKVLKPRTLADRLGVWKRDIKPFLGDRILSDISPDDLWSIVEAKGDVAPVRANRLAGQLRMMWAWFTSRAGKRAGITIKDDPTADMSGSVFAPSANRTRILSDDEIRWFMAALQLERASYRRALAMMLITGCRYAEVVEAPVSEYRDGIWTIPADRVKNNKPHAITLGPLGRSLFEEATGEWLAPSATGGLIGKQNWYRIRDRVHARMERIAKRPLARWSFHDLRRTLRSNTFRLGIQYEVAEAMLNHTRQGLERRYDVGDLSDYTRDGFARWEAHVVSLTVATG